MAIARDATSSKAYNASTTSPATWSHTCTGTSSNGLLLVKIFVYNITVSSVTYNGVASDWSKSNSATGDGLLICYIFAFKNPAVGTNTISATLSATGQFGAIAVSYTGVDTTNFPDASANQNHASTFPTDYTWSPAITTVAANCWFSGIDGGYYGIDTFNSGGAKQNDDAKNTIGFDSNGAVAAGSNSVSLTTSGGGGPNTCVLVSLAPASGGGGTPGNTKRFFMLMGIGT